MSRKFTKFPKMWQLCLEKKHATGSMYRVALYLLDKAAFSEQVSLGNRVLEKHSVSPASKWRALKLFGEVGLIAVERRRGRPPLVKVRWVD
jgi:hypothetical protein